MKNKITQSLKNKIKKIKLLAVDVDGVLTDGSMFYADNNVEFKRFYVRDGMGMHLLLKSGFKVAIITFENNQAVQNRADKLNISDLFMGSRNKVKSAEILLKRYNLKWENICFIGDDINDFEVLKKVGLAITPADGIIENKNIADYVTSKKGGFGAVREVCDLIIKIQNIKVLF